jgi:hypothetical protein
MNLYHSTSKGLRESQQARRNRLQQHHHESECEHKKKHRKPSLIARLLHWRD